MTRAHREADDETSPRAGRRPGAAGGGRHARGPGVRGRTHSPHRDRPPAAGRDQGTTDSAPEARRPDAGAEHSRRERRRVRERPHRMDAWVGAGGRRGWTAGRRRDTVPGGLHQQAGRRCRRACARVPRAAVARPGHQHLPDVVEAAGQRIHGTAESDAEAPLVAHRRRHGLRVPRIRGRGSGPDAPAAARWRAAGEFRSRPRRHPGRHALAIRRRGIRDRAARDPGRHEEAVRRRASRARPRAGRHVAQHLRPAAAR